MKKIIASLAMFGVALATYGQGYVILGNSSSSLAVTNTGTGTSGSVRGAGQYLFELYVAPGGTTTANSPAWRTTGIITGNSGVSAGRLTSTVARQVTGMPFATGVGDTVAVQVRGWSTRLGANYAAAAAGTDTTAFIGMSGGANYTLGADIPPPPVVMDVLGGVTLYPVVPEPSVIALGVLGLGAMLFIRRRK